MRSRLELHDLFIDILGTRNEEVSRVYFQPPASLMMNYPCIVYGRSSGDTKYANDIKYHRMKQYQVTVIDADPDSVIPDKIENFPLCKFSTHFTKDNLNHDVYMLYY